MNLINGLIEGVIVFGGLFLVFAAVLLIVAVVWSHL